MDGRACGSGEGGRSQRQRRRVGGSAARHIGVTTSIWTLLGFSPANRFNDDCQHQKPVKDAICSWLAGVRNTISPVTVPFLHIANLPHVSAILHFAMNQRIQFASGFIVGRDDQCPLGFSCILSARPHLDGELEGRTATFLSSMTPRSRQCANLLPPAQTLSSAEFVVSWRPSCISSLSH